VLTEYHRLKQVASGKNVPIYFPPSATPAVPAATLAQKSAAPAKSDNAPAEIAHGSSQTGETVAGL